MIDKLKQVLNKDIKIIKEKQKQAAVVLPLIKKGDNFSLLYEKRVDNGSLHGGQISFPGGSIEPTDKSIEYAAVRETEEEIGISMKKIEILGALDATVTLRSDFAVYPFVGVLHSSNFNINKQEIENIFDIPLDYLIRIHPFEKRPYTYKNKNFTTLIIEYNNETVWGATARITDMLIEKIKKAMNFGGKNGI